MYLMKMTINTIKTKQKLSKKFWVVEIKQQQFLQQKNLVVLERGKSGVLNHMIGHLILAPAAQPVKTYLCFSFNLAS